MNTQTHFDIAAQGPLMRVLLVSESRDEREMYAECLRQEGYCTLEADCASDAYRLASEATPDIVVTGVRLTGQIDGLALTRQLKADEHTRGVPVVVLSGFVSQRYRDAAAQAGCDLFLLKPCLPVELLDVIARLVEHNGHRKAGSIAGVMHGSLPSRA